MNKLAYSLLLTYLVSCSTPKTDTEESKTTSEGDYTKRWTVEMTRNWKDQYGWMVGCNFIPSTAINQLEMWQEESFDEETISKELQWAADIGFNSVRVYLHDLLWDQDSTGFVERMDRFLTIADGVGISTMFVIFDGVWDENPQLGTQRKPRPRVHNSGWMQSPGNFVLVDTTQWSRLERYTRGVVNAFREDKRINSWDLFNEPDNSVGSIGPEKKLEMSVKLIKKTLQWVREEGPVQPLTMGVWRHDWREDSLTDFNRLLLDNSDIISFHAYGSPEIEQSKINLLKRYNRPMICTEYLARGNNNTFQTMLPFFKENGISAINWGLVDGKTQTIYPWISWDSAFVAEPEPWHHDIFRSDGTPYRQEEVDLIRELTSSN